MNLILIKRCREVVVFALPIIIGEMGQVFFGIGDVLVAGRYSTDVLAALGAACGFFFPFLILGMGVMYAISPIKAQWLGEKKDTTLFPSSSLMVAILTGIAMVAALEALTFFLDSFSLQPQIVPLVKTYLRIAALSLFPVFIFGALKENLLAFGKTIYPNTLIIIFNIINILGNIFLMIICDLGIAGAAIATVVTRSLMTYALYVHTRHKLGIQRSVCWLLIHDLAKRGMPIGLNNMMSGLIFCIVAVMAGRMSVLDSAANNIVLNMTSLTFMVPFALAGVGAVKIGRAYGEKNHAEMKLYAWATVIPAFCFSALVGCMFYMIPEPLIRITTNDPQVINYAVAFMFYIALYQVPDALQIVILGCLRGVGVVKFPLVLGFIGIWCIGLPAGAYFSYSCEMGAAGLWAGLSLGLGVMATLLLILFIRHFHFTMRSS